MNSNIKRISDIVDRKEYRVFSENCDLVYLNNSQLISVGENGFVEKFKKFFKTIWAKVKALIKYLILKFKRNKSIDERIQFSKMKVYRIKNKLEMAYRAEYEDFTIDTTERILIMSGGIDSPILKSAENFLFYLNRTVENLTDKSGELFTLLKEMFRENSGEERDVTYDAFSLGEFSGVSSYVLKNNNSIYNRKENLDIELDKKNIVKMNFQDFVGTLKFDLHKLVDIGEKSINKAKENIFEKEFKEVQKLVDEGWIDKYFELHGKNYHKIDTDGHFTKVIRNIPEAIQGYLNLYDSTVSICNRLLDLSDECISIFIKEIKTKNGKKIFKKIKGGKDVK